MVRTHPRTSLRRVGECEEITTKGADRRGTTLKQTIRAHINVCNVHNINTDEEQQAGVKGSKHTAAVDPTLRIVGDKASTCRTEQATARRNIYIGRETGQAHGIYLKVQAATPTNRSLIEAVATLRIVGDRVSTCTRQPYEL
jgi:hypothetical protein